MLRQINSGMILDPGLRRKRVLAYKHADAPGSEEFQFAPNSLEAGRDLSAKKTGAQSNGPQCADRQTLTRARCDGRTPRHAVHNRVTRGTGRPTADAESQHWRGAIDPRVAHAERSALLTLG